MVGKKVLIRKSLVIGIIILMLGVNIGSTFAGDVDVKTMSSTGFDGNTLYVGGSGPNNYTKIQDAINDANPGDTVFVYDDSSPYYELLLIDKPINLIGENRYSTTIDGNWEGTVITIRTDNVIISHFTLRNCKYCIYDFEYNVIDAENCKNLVIKDNIIYISEYMPPLDRAGVYLQHCSNNLIQNNIIYNSKIQAGTCGVVITIDSDNNNVSGNEIYNLIFGIEISRDNGDNCDDNIIYGNYIHDSHAGVRIDDSSNHIINNILSHNLICGVYVNSQDNVISGNLINDNGWYIWPYGGIALSCSNNLISENHIFNNTPVGIYIDGYYGWGNNNILNNNISDNTATGIYCESNGGDKISYNHISNQRYGVVFYLSENNHVTDNHISNNIEAGVYAYFGYNNIISRNNLIDNGENAFFEVKLSKSFSNRWRENYWSDYSVEKSYKIINGRFSIFLLFSFPWFNIDWNPAQEPYDIGV